MDELHHSRRTQESPRAVGSERIKGQCRENHCRGNGGKLGYREQGQRPDVDGKRHDRQKEDHHLRIAESQRQRGQERAPPARSRRRSRGEGQGPGRHFPGEIEQVCGSCELDCDKNAGEGFGDDCKSRRRHEKPDRVADKIAGDERRDALQPLAEHPGD
jgi:hypothetical protein